MAEPLVKEVPPFTTIVIGEVWELLPMVSEALGRHIHPAIDVVIIAVQLVV